MASDNLERRGRLTALALISAFGVVAAPAYAQSKPPWALPPAPEAAAPASEETSASPATAEPSEPPPAEGSGGSETPASAAAPPAEVAAVPAPAVSAAAPSAAPAATPATPTESASLEHKRGALDGSFIGAGVALGILNLPKLGAGLRVLGQIRSASFMPLDIAAVYWFDNDADLTSEELDVRANPLLGLAYPAGGSRLRLSAVQASVAGCPYERDLSPGTLTMCAGVLGGQIRARAMGFETAHEQRRGMLALEGYARWHFEIGDKLGVTYSAGLFVSLLRDSFGYVDRFGAYVDKFRAAPVGGRLDLAFTYAP